MEVFNRLLAAGITLRGKRCRIGMKTIAYLGHVFSAQGVAKGGQGNCKGASTWGCGHPGYQ